MRTLPLAVALLSSISLASLADTRAAPDAAARIAALEKELGPLETMEERTLSIEAQRRSEALLRVGTATPRASRILREFAAVTPRNATAQALTLSGLAGREPRLDVVFADAHADFEQLGQAFQGRLPLGADVRFTKATATIEVAPDAPTKVQWSSLFRTEAAGATELPSEMSVRLAPEQRLADLELLRAAPDRARAALEALEVAQLAADRALPRTDGHDTFEATLSTAASSAMTTASVEWQDPLGDGALVTLPAKIKVTGPFHGIVQLLYQLEGAERVTVVHAVAVSNPRRRQALEVVDAEIDLKVFRFDAARAVPGRGRLRPDAGPRDARYFPDPVGIRDPFHAKDAWVSTAGRQVAAETCAEPAMHVAGGLERVDPETLAFLFARVTTDDPAAVLLDRAGGCHVVRNGDRLGPFRIVAIRHSWIDLTAVMNESGPRPFHLHTRVARTYGAVMPVTFHRSNDRKPARDGSTAGEGRYTAPGWEFSSVVGGPDGLWAASDAANLVARLDFDGKVRGVFAVGPAPTVLGADADQVYVSIGDGTSAVRLRVSGERVEVGRASALDPTSLQALLDAQPGLAAPPDWFRDEGVIGRFGRGDGNGAGVRIPLPGKDPVLWMGDFAWHVGPESVVQVVDLKRGKVRPLQPEVVGGPFHKAPRATRPRFDGSLVWTSGPSGVTRWRPDGRRLDDFSVATGESGAVGGAPDAIAGGKAWFRVREGSHGLVSVPLDIKPGSSAKAPKPARGGR